MKFRDIKFFCTTRVKNGVIYHTEVGLGSDGILWVNPAGLGIRPEDAKDFKNFKGKAPVMLVDSVKKRFFVNAQVLAEFLNKPEDRQEMKRAIEMLRKQIDMVRQMGRQQNENFRNN